MQSKSTDDQTNLTEPVSEEKAVILDVEVEDQESEISEQDLEEAFDFSDEEFDVNEWMTDPSAFNWTNLMDFPLEEIKEVDDHLDDT